MKTFKTLITLQFLFVKGYFSTVDWLKCSSALNINNYTLEVIKPWSGVDPGSGVESEFGIFSWNRSQDCASKPKQDPEVNFVIFTASQLELDFNIFAKQEQVSTYLE